MKPKAFLKIVQVNSVQALTAGETVFITGGNGSGKSSLVKLLCGLYEPTSGTITVDGHSDMTRHRYLFSAIFSDYHLFDALYGVDNFDPHTAAEFLKTMGIAHKTGIDRDGMLTNRQLSTGQKKRLALVVLLLENKPIYIFDEWAADQDPYFRQNFYEELLPSFKAQNKTVIAVTHDEHYFHTADRVIEMRYGQIIHDTKRTSSKEPEYEQA